MKVNFFQYEMIVFKVSAYMFMRLYVMLQKCAARPTITSFFRGSFATNNPNYDIITAYILRVNKANANDLFTQIMQFNLPYGD